MAAEELFRKLEPEFVDPYAPIALKLAPRHNMLASEIFVAMAPALYERLFECRDGEEMVKLTEAVGLFAIKSAKHFLEMLDQQQK